MITKQRLESTLNKINYHKATVFVNRCIVESNGEAIFTAGVIREVSYAMLDGELEKQLFLNLGI